MNNPTQATQPTARLIEIDDEYAGQRLDNFLLARLRGAPRSLVYRIVRSGEVRVNSGRVKVSQRLVAGDKVRIPPVSIPDRAEAPAPGKGLQSLLAKRVLYEDDALLVVNKPSGLAVHGGSGVSVGLIEALRSMLPDARSLELVHRLDRDTSGCILIAKKRSMLRHLHEALRQSTLDKRYLALVAGRWPRRKTRLNAPLEKNVLKSGERMVRVSEEGKRSETLFSIVECFPGATLVEAKPVTGRTHQIRVHAQYAGHPLACDDKYGDKDFDQRMRELGLKRLFLHASRLDFRLPDGRALSIKAPLDMELEQLLVQLRGLDDE